MLQSIEIRKHEIVQVSQTVKFYNVHMGGVFLLNSIIGRSKIIIRTRKLQKQVLGTTNKMIMTMNCTRILRLYRVKSVA